MSHDARFPDSPESPEQRTDRALAALQYEERAGLGYRRRDRGTPGDPYGEPERFQVDREPTSGELWAGLIAGIGAVLGVAAVFYKPLLLGTFAVIFTIIGSMGDGQAARIARVGIICAALGTTIGMLAVIFVTHKTAW